MTLLEDIVTYLTNEGTVQGAGIDTFIDFKPETPDNIVSLHEYQGDPVSPYTNVVHRSVQVVVRNKTATEAKRLAVAIYNKLLPVDETKKVVFTDNRWGQVHLRHNPHKFSQDESDRIHYGFNFGITTTLE